MAKKRPRKPTRRKAASKPRKGQRKGAGAKRPRLPSEVFLSHSSANRRFVNQLAEILRSHGVPVWLSSTNLAGAQQWHDEIGAALKRCDWFLVVLSKRSVRSEWVKREVVRALDDNRYRGRFIPVRLQKCDIDRLSWTIEAMQIVDCLEDKETGFQELLRIWGIGYRPR